MRSARSGILFAATSPSAGSRWLPTALRSPLCRWVAAGIFGGILAVEAAVLIPAADHMEQLRLADLRQGAQSIVAGFVAGGGREFGRLVGVGGITAVALHGADGSRHALYGEAMEFLPPEGSRYRPEARRLLLSWRHPAFPQGWLMAAVDTTSLAGTMRSYLLRAAALGTVLALLLSALMLSLLQRRLLGPLAELGARMRLAAAEPETAPRYHGASPAGGDLGALLRSYEGMLDRFGEVIGKLHQREEELGRQSLLLQTTLDHIGHGISVYDADLRLVALNRRFLAIMDFPPEFGEVGTPFAEFIRYNALRGEYGPGDIEHQVARRVAVAREWKPHVMERTRPNGTIIEVRGNPLPSGGFVTTYTDITERERAKQALRASEERLRERVLELEETRARLEQQGRELALLAESLSRARDEAEAASRTKSDFLANMSHELRTPLNAVIGFSEIMVREMYGPLGDGRYREYAADIRDSGGHLLDVINDILDLSKVEAGRLELNESRVRLNDAAQASARLIRERADQAGVQLLVNCPDRPLAVRADEIKLKQILLNLLSNAIKFTPRGGSIRLSVEPEPGGGVALRVADSGIGMRDEDIPLALQPFRQVESALSRRHAGTGLGLPLVKALAEMHGAEFRIESRAGFGTTATVTLPACRVLPPDPD